MADASQNEIETMSVKEFNTRLQTDQEFSSRYLKNPQAPEFAKINESVATLIEQHGDRWVDHIEDAPGDAGGSPQGSSTQGSSQGSTETAVDVGGLAGDEEIEVKVKVPKNLFGTYLTGRTPDQAVIEALKGNQQKDATIKVLKEHSMAAHDASSSLRNRVKKTIEQMSRPQVPALPQEVLDAAAVNVDEIDFLDPDGVDKVRRGNKAMADFVKNIQKPAQQVMDATAKMKKELADLDEETEYAEIRKIQLKDPTLMTSMDIKTLDKSVIAFLEGLSRVSGGLSGADAWTLYNDPTKGEQFKNQCAAAGVVAPSEIGQHIKIMEARSKILPLINEERAKEAERLTTLLRKSGRLSANDVVKVEEVDMPSYSAIWERINASAAPAQAVPPVAPQPAAPAAPSINPALQQQIEARRSQEQAAAVPLLPPGATSVPVDPGQIDFDMFLGLDEKFRKNPISITKDEAAMLKAGYEFAKVPIPPALQSKL